MVITRGNGKPLCNINDMDCFSNWAAVSFFLQNTVMRILKLPSKSWWYLPRVRRICHWVLPQPALAAWGWGPVGTGYLSGPPRSTWFLEVHHSETTTRDSIITENLLHDSSEFLLSPATGNFNATTATGTTESLDSTDIGRFTARHCARLEPVQEAELPSRDYVYEVENNSG